uniref:Uncharacterized protein n=1 Tax=Ailuropoda melanoleuca TaxID=9646 RepID=A0A7N5JY70_AILME
LRISHGQTGCRMACPWTQTRKHLLERSTPRNRMDFGDVGLVVDQITTCLHLLPRLVENLPRLVIGGSQAGGGDCH